MIQDPGAGPSESPEPQPASKYERVAYDIHRPSAAAAPVAMQVDPESPLDMTVRRKDCDRQGDTSPGGEPTSCPNSARSSTDAPINLNMRPSVITKAPPPPIKKRISSMHSNGEIVIKNTAGDNLSPVNCDVFIEEHFRRSLGNTYASIYGPNNNNNTTQQKGSGSDTRNSSTSSSSSISSSSSSSAISTGSSLNSTTGLSSSSLANFSITSQLQAASNPVVRPAQTIAPLEVTPILKVKAEASLIQPQQQHQQQQQQLLQHARSELKATKKEPGTVQHVRPDSEEEVDDHFAKALGNDTWKMIQEKKMNL